MQRIFHTPEALKNFRKNGRLIIHVYPRLMILTLAFTLVMMLLLNTEASGTFLATFVTEQRSRAGGQMG